MRFLRSSVLPRVACATALITLPAVLSCGGGGSDATAVLPTPEIAAVVLTGVPAQAVMVGQSVTLVAAATNSTGGVISDQAVSWKSSAPSIAGVSSSGTVLALSAGRAVITATIGGKDGSATFDIADGASVTSLGGTITAAAGLVSLAVPAGGVSQPTLILIRPAPTPLAEPRILTSTAYEFGPVGTPFRGTLSVKFDRASIPAGLAVESLQLYVQSGGSWILVPGSKVDLATNTVSGFVLGSGVYVVRSTPVDRIVVLGAAANGAIYANQSAQLRASLYAATNDTLPSRPITWSSSDASKITIDAGGKVTAVAAGSATISASTDGKSATTTITVLPRPTANWSNATDWTTYQGNSRHSGYAAVTVDPVVFTEKWVSTVVTSGGLNAPTTGGGKLYVSTNAYFGGQQLIALDPTDGSRRWQRDFGAIFGINQPLYDNGVLYITSGGHQDTYLWAIRESDGSLKYQTPFGNQWSRWKAPVVAGSTVVTAGGYYGGMYGFDLATGAQTFFRAGVQVDGWAPVAAPDGSVFRTGGGLIRVNPLDGTVAATNNDPRFSPVVTPVVGDANELLAIVSNRLMSVDLTSLQVNWDQSGSFTGMPVVGNGVVYGLSGTVVAARRESDGALLWSWQPPSPFTTPVLAGTQSIALTNNLLIVSLASDFSGSVPGATIAIDLDSRLTVWSYPLAGDVAISKEGMLYIVSGAKVAAIAIR
jgi:hypothetical protein